jgi:hypothetical protein
VANGYGIFSGLWDEAAGYADHMFLVAPCPEAQPEEGFDWQPAAFGFRASAVIAWPVQEKGEAAARIIAAARARYPQLPGILLWATQIARAWDDPDLQEAIAAAWAAIGEDDQYDFIHRMKRADPPLSTWSDSALSLPVRYRGEYVGTIAHALVYGFTPDSLPLWPPDWPGWGWRDETGKTVAQLLMRFHGMTPSQLWQTALVAYVAGRLGISACETVAEIGGHDAGR